MLTRRTPLRSSRRKNTGPNGAIRAWVIVRDEGCCVRCGHIVLHQTDEWGTFELTDRGYQFHHRKPRGMGGGKDTNKHANLILVCPPCHAWIESNRRAAYEFGWLVHHWDNPATVPVVDFRRGLILLDNNGQWKAAE